MINIISPGEITVGNFIMPIDEKPIKKWITTMFGETKEIEEHNKNPWFKGIPWEVIGVAGPIIAVKTHGIQSFPPVVFFDTRMVNFVEVENDFAKAYWENTLKPSINPNKPSSVGFSIGGKV